MFHSLLILLVTSGISFLGSVQLGPVNLAVMQSVLEGRRKGAILMGLGVCIPEFIYATIALFAAAWLLQHETLLKILEWGVVPLLVGMGIYNIFRKSENFGDDVNKKQEAADLLKGVIISFLNPQLLPYWLMILVMLNGYEFFAIHTVLDKIMFVIGTGLGEFILIALVVWVTHRFRHYFLEKLKRWSLNKIFGVLFLFLAALQSVKLTFIPQKK
jgi:threonine/homoserine/homoserine lactone efflux protein